MASIRFKGEQGEVKVWGYGFDWECRIEISIQHSNGVGSAISLSPDEARAVLAALPAEIDKAEKDHAFTIEEALKK